MEQPINQSVHRVLANSYLSYFLLLSLGVCLGVFFPMKFIVPHTVVLTVLCFGIGPLLIMWAQLTSSQFEVIKQKTGEIHFNRGPYRYLRNPTQLGLVILVLGYALVSQSAILFVTFGVAYLVANVFFRKHESILESRYGEKYKEYKSTVHKVL